MDGRRTVRGLALAALFWMSLPALKGQAGSELPPPSYIEVDKAATLENFFTNGTRIRKLSGDVVLHQDTVFLLCDTAVLRDNFARITGHVRIQQGDSLTIYADSLQYDGNSRQARLFGQVILKRNLQELHTHRLDYNLATKRASYVAGGVLKNRDSRLYSRKGTYFVSDDMVYFKDSVRIRNPKFSLVTDTLAFHTVSRKAFFLAPTLIRQGGAEIYCESGYYDLNSGDALFSRHAQYRKGSQTARADTMTYRRALETVTLTGHAAFRDGAKEATADKIIYKDDSAVTVLLGHAVVHDGDSQIKGSHLIYDARTKRFESIGRVTVSDPPQIIEADRLTYEKTAGTGTAGGRVIWRDTVQRIAVYCDTADFDRRRDYLLARGGEPLLVQAMDEDTLYMRSDTLLSWRDTLPADAEAGDTVRYFAAFRHVRIYKRDLQAVCDSLGFSTADSTFRLYYDPMAWADTTQFSADTMYISTRDDTIRRIRMRQNSFMIHSTDLVLFDQVAGKDVTVFFDKGRVSQAFVEGNARSVYFAEDTGKGYIGVNKVEASSMRIFFKNNQIQRIRYYDTPKGEMYPMKDVNPEDYKLKGYRWEPERRPTRSIKNEKL